MNDPLEDLLREAVQKPVREETGEVPPLTPQVLREALQRASDAPPRANQPWLISPRLAAEIRRERGLTDDAPIDSEMVTSYVMNRRIEDY